MNKYFINKANEHKTEFALFKDKFFPAVMAWEGGGKLHNVPGDTGGQTIWGIAYNKNKQHFTSLADHARTTRDEAAAFAFVEYYLPLHPEFLPCNCKLYLFDIAYNMGVNRAKTMLQSCIGVKADGIIGPATKAKMKDLKLECLHNSRTALYRQFAKVKSQAKFLDGWLNRANDMYRRSE